MEFVSKGAEAAASYAKAKAWIGLVVGVLISIGMFVGAFFIIRNERAYSGKISGKVVSDPTCQTVATDNSGGSTTTCSFDVEVSRGGNTVVRPMALQRTVSKDDTVQLEYDPSSYPDSLKADTNHMWWSVGLIAAAVIVLAGFIMNLVLVKTNSTYAAVTGTADIVKTGMDVLKGK